MKIDIDEGGKAHSRAITAEGVREAHTCMETGRGRNV